MIFLIILLHSFCFIGCGLHLAPSLNTQRIQMDIPHQLPEIYILVTNHRPVTVLKKMAAAMMPMVVGHYVSSPSPIE
jgi:hypothetical protein